MFHPRASDVMVKIMRQCGIPVKRNKQPTGLKFFVRLPKLYAEFKGDRLVVKKDIHIIDDELRQWFVEERDDKMRMLYEEIDPGLAECYDYCPYILHCRG